MYLLTFFLFFYFSFVEIRTEINVNLKNVLYFFLFLFLVFQVGFRWETGTDWHAYRDNFLETTSYKIVLDNVLSGYEIGYGVFVWIIRLFTSEYTVFLVVHAVIYYYFILKANKFLSPFPFLSLLLIYTTTMGILGSNRQLIAICLCYYSLQFILYDRKPLKFFLVVLLAFFFHKTALLFLVYYFLNRDFNKQYVILALIVAFLIGKSSIPNYLFLNFSDFLGETSVQKAQKYVGIELSKTALSITGLIRRLLFFSLFMISYDRIVEKFPTYKLLFNGFTVGLIIYFMFSSTFVILVGRGGYYFTIMECFLLASLLLMFESKIDRAYLLIFFFIYSYFIFYQSISEYPELFTPYKGVNINTSFIRRFK